jgi:hypothetical protein
MSDPKPDDPANPAATPGPRDSRSIEASRRLSQLLARPLGAPAPPGETAFEPYAPPVARPAEPPPPQAPPREPDIVSPPPPAVAPEPPAAAPAHVEAPPSPFVAPEAPGAPVERAAETGPAEVPVHHTPDERPAWPPLDAAPEPHAPQIDHPAEPEPVEAPVRRARREMAAPSPEFRAAVEVPPPAPPPAAAERPLEPDASRALAKIRRLMLISNLFMLIAVAAVLGVIAYRVFRAEPVAPPAPPPPAPVAAPAPAPADIPVDMTLTLPRGARILQSAVAEDRIVITLEIDGAVEIRTFDLKTLQPAGRLGFATVP